MWMMPLHLRVNQKSDYDYDDDAKKKLNLLYANNKGADQPAYSCSLISAFIIYSMERVRS